MSSSSFIYELQLLRTAFKRYQRLKIWLYYWPKIVPSVVSFIILIFLIISYFWFYIWRLNIKHCHQKFLVWWKKCEIPINYLIFLHFLGEKIAFTSNATYILLYLTSRSTVAADMFFKQLTQSPHLQTRKTYPQFDSIWDLHVLEIFVSLFWKSSDSSSCDLGFSIDHHIHQLGVAVQSEWVHKRKSWVSVLYISLETLFQWGLFVISQ